MICSGKYFLEAQKFIITVCLPDLEYRSDFTTSVYRFLKSDMEKTLIRFISLLFASYQLVGICFFFIVFNKLLITSYFINMGLWRIFIPFFDINLLKMRSLNSYHFYKAWELNILSLGCLGEKMSKISPPVCS